MHPTASVHECRGLSVVGEVSRTVKTGGQINLTRERERIVFINFIKTWRDNETRC